MATSQAPTRQAITLKGSTNLVTEFFKYAANTILFQRGVYPSDDFHMVKKYGQTVLVTQDLALENYLDRVAADRVRHAAGPRDHLKGHEATSREMGVRHQSSSPPADSAEPPPPKPESEIQAEIRYILKQIVSTVTFLPIIDDPTVFNILAYTHDSADVPADEWVDTDPLAIEASKSQQVKLRSFSTDVHRIEAMVAYRYEG
ncbi:spindle assembly checkpoint protein [Lanmaoa asiatica]|nr:spindle assembly checkpoint protein [Lanmaoa asiatica]